MIFRSSGYNLQFIQRRQIKDKSAHLYTYIYKFYSPRTKLVYIINADYHTYEVFAIKFYAKMHRRSKNKYSLLTNRGDVYNILISCAKLVPELLKNFPNSSFGFCGARSIDIFSNKVEGINETQRFRIYRHLVSNLFGTKTFKHYEYPLISSYLLVNKKYGKIEETEKLITRMFSSTYNNLPDIDI